MIRSLALIALLSAFSPAAVAAVPPAYVAIAEEQGVPADLLYAIAKTESNAGFAGKPWPWTLNVRGAPMYFETRAHALAYLEYEVGQGEDRIAIGLLQIYLRYHADRITSLADALDPETNLRLGAAFLRELYDRHRDWDVAVACYHHCDRKSPGIGDAYAGIVATKLAAVRR